MKETRKAIFADSTRPRVHNVFRFVPPFSSPIASRDACFPTAISSQAPWAEPFRKGSRPQLTAPAGSPSLAAWATISVFAVIARGDFGALAR